MKITQKYLKQIIQEEIGRGFGQGAPAKDEFSKKREVYLEEEVPEESEDEELELSQVVSKMVNYLPDIKSKIHYGQLVTAVIKHAANIQGGKLALISLYKDLLPKIIKSMK